MKIGITVDEVHATAYSVGKYDFYTREVVVEDDLAKFLQGVAELTQVGQRVMSSLYNSYGKFVLPEDLEKLSCLIAALQTPVQQSEKQPKPKDSAPASKSESRRLSAQQG